MRPILVLFVAGLAVATDFQNPFEPLVNIFKSEEIPSVARINQGLDELVQIIADLLYNNGFMENYYPMNVPDVNLRYTANLQSNQYQGVWHLVHGKLFGLDQIYRYGDAELTYDQHFFYIKPHVLLKDVSILYNSLVKIRDVEQEETVIISMEKLIFTYIIKINRHNLNISPENSVIESISPIDVKVKQNNHIDQQINNVFNFDATAFYNLIVDFVTTNIIEELIPLADEINSRLNS